MKRKFLILLGAVLLFVGTAFTFEQSPVKQFQEIRNIGISTALANGAEINDGNSIVKIMGNIHVGEGEEVFEDVVAIMGNITIDGPVRGNVISIIGNIDLNNTVQGDVISVLGKINMGPNGKVYGEIIEANRPQIIAGDYIGFAPFFNWGFKVFNLVLLFVIGSLVLALIPDKIKAMSISLQNDLWRKLFIGFIALILMPLVVLTTLISIIGIPLVPFIVLLFIGGKFIGYVAVALYLGTLIRTTAAMNLNIFVELFLGVLALWILRAVPFVGFLSYLLVTMFALGAIIDTKFGTHRPWFKKKEYQSISSLESQKDEKKDE